MPFDFNKLKQDFLARQEERKAAQEEKQAIQEEIDKSSKEPKKPSALSAKLEPLKRGLVDVKAMLEEGNIKLFIKQLAVILLACWGVWTLTGKLSAQKAQIEDRVSAISLQQTHQDDYLSNKDRLLRLEPLFPDMGKKNEWLIKTLMGLFSAHEIEANINGNAVEKVDSNYTIVSQEVTFRNSFANLGHFLADVESGNDFLRISNLTISKLTDTGSLGQNTINIRFNTVFPKEKYAKRLFKDYDQQMKQIEAAMAAEEKQAAQQGKDNAGEPPAANSATEGTANAS